jgi:hypothetical protein
MASLPTILLILAALSLGATVIAALIAFRSQREALNAIFPIVREEESLRAQRARISIFVWIAVTALFLGGWLATLRLGSSNETPITSRVGDAAPPPTAPAEAVIVRLVTGSPFSEVTPPTVHEIEAQTAQVTPESLGTNTPTSLPATATEALTDTPTSQPSATSTSTPPLPTATLTDTPIPPTATPTPTDIPSPTPAPPTATFIRPVALPFPTTPPHTPAPPEIRVGPIQFATQITEDLKAIDPRDSFPGDTKSIYAVYPVSGMKRDLPIKAVWFRNGVEIANEVGRWEWPADTRSFTFFTPKGEGLYKLELYANDTIVATKLFEIR